MARVVRSSEIWVPEAFETLAQRTVAEEEFVLPGGPVGDLQRQLAESYAVPSTESGLSVRHRLAIIVGSASIVWLLIGAGIHFVLA